VLDEVPQQRIRQPVLIGPRRVAEDPVQRLRVRLLDAPERGLQRLADIGRDSAYVVPMAAFRNLKSVVSRKPGVFLVPFGFCQRRLIFLVMCVADALEEEQREDEGLEIGRIDGTTQDVRGLPEMRLELSERDLFW